MGLSSTLFLCMFLPITLLGYYLKREDRRNKWLLLASLLFCAWAGPGDLWVIFLNILINYACARLIDHADRPGKPALVAAIAANLAILFFFKYFGLVSGPVNRILGCDLVLREIALPIGLSVITFQGISYVTDVYRKEVPAQKNLLKMSLYILMFPKLTAGPIMRYKDIAPGLERRTVTRDDFSSGIERLIAGLGKKVLIADTLAVMVDAIWANGASGNTWIIAWAGSIAYTLQIYYDFSGYSDMAVGLGRMFGFHFKENFDLPYASGSMTEFWRRWHISLSDWFREYVYIPLGGNRKHVYRNLAIVFLLTGLWHGGPRPFLAWSLWHGTFVLIERAVMFRSSRIADDPDRQKRKRPLYLTVLSKVYMLLVVHFGWILFRAPTLKEALEYVSTMFGLLVPDKVGFTLFWYLDRWTVTMLVLGILFASSFPVMAAARIKKQIPESVSLFCKYMMLIAVFYLSMIQIVGGTYHPFIYFQF